MLPFASLVFLKELQGDPLLLQHLLLIHHGVVSCSRSSFIIARTSGGLGYYYGWTHGT